MLDLYDPKPRQSRAQRVRKWVGYSGATLVFLYVTALVVVPLILPRALRFGVASAGSVASAGEWEYGAPVPAQREWAFSVEPSLAGVCRATLTQMRDAKYLMGFLGPRLEAKWRQPTPAELADVTTAMGSDEGFVGDCLRWGYDALEGCHKPGQPFEGADALACATPRVNRALLIAPWKRCADGAKLGQVKSACLNAAQAMQRWADRSAGM